MMPFVPIWLFYRFKYFKVSEFCREFPIFYALASPSELPWKFKLTRDEQLSKHLTKI